MAALGLFIAWPLLALLPAAAFFALARQRRRAALWVAGWAWLLYAGYEVLMQGRVLCSGEYNIRVDLLALYPVLLVVSFVAAVVWFHGRRA